MLTRWEKSQHLVSQPMSEVLVVAVSLQRFELGGLSRVSLDHTEEAVVRGCVPPEFK